MASNLSVFNVSSASRSYTLPLIHQQKKYQLLDFACSSSVVLALAVGHPDEHTVENPCFAVFAASTDDLDEGKAMQRLFGHGLSDVFGSGFCLDEPHKIISLDTKYFAIIGSKGIAHRDHSPAPLPIAVFEQESESIARLLHILEEPISHTGPASEYDLSISSVNRNGDSLAALLRWRSTESPSRILHATKGAGLLLQGWESCEAVVWGWRTGKIAFRVPVPAEITHPRAQLVSPKEINLSSPEHKAIVPHIAGTRSEEEGLWNAVDTALQFAVVNISSSAHLSDLRLPVITAEAVRLPPASVPMHDSTAPCYADIEVKISRILTLSPMRAIYKVSPAQKEVFRHLSKSKISRNQQQSANRYYIVDYDTSVISDCLKDAVIEKHVYRLSLDPIYPSPENLIGNLDHTPVPFVRTLEEDLVTVANDLARPGAKRSQSTSTAASAHSRQSSISSLFTSIESGASSPPTPSSPTEEKQRKSLDLFFMPISNQELVKLLESGAQIAEGHLFSAGKECLQVYRLPE